MKGKFNSHNFRLFVPKTLKQYLYYYKTLELSYLSLKWDFEYSLTENGWDEQTSILADDYLQAKENFQNFKNSQSSYRFTNELLKLKVLQ